MENYNKILELLEKKVLTPEEKTQLGAFLKDHETAGFIKGYRNVEKALSKGHVSVDDFADYIMYKNGVEPEDNLTPYKLPAIDMHLKQCSKCRAELEELKSEFIETGDFVSRNLYTEDKTVENKAAESPVYRRNIFKPLYAFASVAALGLVYILLYAASAITTPDNLKFAAIEEEKDIYLTRGRTSDEFLKSYEAIENNDYSTALNHLQQDIKNNPDDETIFYSYYIMGLTRLEISHNSFLGLFTSYDKNLVTLGLKDLERSVEMNKSGKFDNIKLDAFYYMAKGKLILDDETSAKQYLKAVVDQKGSKMNEAALILNELE